MSPAKHLTTYNPDASPDAASWLALPEAQRLRAVTHFHSVHKERAGGQKAHAAMHVIVENQIATGFGPTVQAMQRLLAQGLRRHEAIHAVGSVLAEHMHRALTATAATDPSVLQSAINRDIQALSAASWRADYGGR